MKKVIISGARRSGTHLLYRLLDGHDAIFNGVVEVYFLEYLEKLSPGSVEWFVDHFFAAPLGGLLDDFHERELLPVLCDDDFMAGNGLPAGWKLDFDFDETRFSELLGARRADADRSVEGIWDCWFDALAQTLDNRADFAMTVAKSPDYGRSVVGAERFFDDFKAIFIVRDPVAAISSMRKLRRNQPHRWNLTTLRVLEEVENYRFMHDTILAIEKRRPGSIRVIRFEDLLNDAKAIVSGLADFLEIEFSERLVQPTLRGRDWGGDSSFGPLKGISRDPLDRAKSLVTEDERALIGRCIPEFLERHRYSVEPTQVRSATR